MLDPSCFGRGGHRAGAGSDASARMSALRPEFTAGPDGTVDVRLGPGWAAFEDALADAVGSRPPAGSDHPGPSAFWIDRTLAALERPSTGGPEAVIAEGNAVQLLRSDAAVVARSLYELWDDQTMPLREFVQVLLAWRTTVLPLYTAPDGSYEIEPRWKEEVVYWEGAQGCVFDAGWGVDPGVLHVPSAASWDTAVPQWLRGRRDEVVRRLAEHSRHRIESTDAGRAPSGGREVRR